MKVDWAQYRNFQTQALIVKSTKIKSSLLLCCQSLWINSLVVGAPDQSLSVRLDCKIYPSENKITPTNFWNFRAGYNPTIKSFQVMSSSESETNIDRETNVLELAWLNGSCVMGSHANSPSSSLLFVVKRKLKSQYSNVLLKTNRSVSVWCFISSPFVLQSSFLNRIKCENHTQKNKHLSVSPFLFLCMNVTIYTEITFHKKSEVNIHSSLQENFLHDKFSFGLFFSFSFPMLIS